MDINLAPRAVLDISFFMVVMTILLNVIFGIIIDTFGSLREEKDNRESVTVNFCFVCGIDKQTFDRAATDGADGFRRHIRFDHCMWNYLKFAIFIWEQDKDDDDGLEQFVRRSIDSGDIGWFPMGKAIRLNQAESEEERLYRESKLVINNTQLSMQTKIDTFQGDLYSALSQLTETLIHAAPAPSSVTNSTSDNLRPGNSVPKNRLEGSSASIASLDSQSVVESITLSEGF